MSQKESYPARRTYSPAEAAADLAFYHWMKRTACLGSLLVVVLPAVLLTAWHPWFALALVVGGVAGIANTLLSMRGIERLLDRRMTGAFAISSFMRIGLFGIVPVILAIRAPSLWTLGCYFAGFFVPLALSAVLLWLRERQC